MIETMVCGTCGRRKNWRDGFPAGLVAQCWKCAWQEHDRQHHPITRKERRRRERAEIAEVKRKYRTQHTDRAYRLEVVA